MKAYRKAVTAGVGFLAALLPIFGISLMDDPTIQTAATSAITAVLVYLVPNA